MAKQTTIWRALNSALRDEMARDDTTFLMGEDITTWGTGGGIYGVTRKLEGEFGPKRVRNTPISEQVLVSAAAGAAMRGARPILEIMYSDFTFLGFDGLMNQAAKSRYMFGGQFSVPMVLRTNGGSGVGKAGQHSQSLETLFAHIPGLEVVVPATSNDAYGLLVSAIRSDNPTVFLEHKNMYYDKGEITYEPVPLGKARVAREGRDATIVATQQMVTRSVEAADRLQSEHGVSVEVIDLRTLYPLDFDTVARSVERTGKLLVVYEAVQDFGWGAEVITRAATDLWQALTAPPVRLGGERTPIPYSEPLESAVVPSTKEIWEAAVQLTARKPQLQS